MMEESEKQRAVSLGLFILPMTNAFEEVYLLV